LLNFFFILCLFIYDNSFYFYLHSLFYSFYFYLLQLFFIFANKKINFFLSTRPIYHYSFCFYFHSFDFFSICFFKLDLFITLYLDYLLPFVFFLIFICSFFFFTLDLFITLYFDYLLQFFLFLSLICENNIVDIFLKKQNYLPLPRFKRSHSAYSQIYYFFSYIYKLN